MKAKNPYGEGTIDVSFPSGPDVKQWAKVCNDCGCCAGGCFSEPGLGEASISPRSVCPGCGGNNLRLEAVTDS